MRFRSLTWSYWLRRVLSGTATLLLLSLAFSPSALARSVDPKGVPGNGEVVRVARPTWDTGWFQSEVLAALLGELGYVVDGPSTLENTDFYQQVAAGSVDVWANGWFPLHENLLEDGSSAVGFQVRGGALQGYLIDRVTVERFGIVTVADLGRPEVAAAFDRDGDEIADLVGCNPGWACWPIVEHHLEAYGLSGRVRQVSGDYGPLMMDVVNRFGEGEPVLFYTFTPNWTTGVLVPGEEVVWLPVPFSSLPAELANQEAFTAVEAVPGCLADPCDLGFAPNDIRSVANADFIDANPAIATLLEVFQIPLEDISDQNAAMIGGQDSAPEIARHAADWIAANRNTINEWLAAATAAHVEAGLELSPPQNRSSQQAGLGVTSLRVVTRVEPPFVTYEDNNYGGFSIEVMELLATQLGTDLEIYGVNSSAKLVDDVARGSADVGIGAVTITSERELSVDFSQPYYQSGLQILVADDNDGPFGGQLGAVFSALISRDLLILVLVLVMVLIVAAHVVWLAERKHNPDFPPSYRIGIWEAIWWAAVTATTVGYGDKTPKGKAGRLFGLFWMFSGLFVLAYFTAGIATAFTIDELDKQIESTADLRGHTVGVTVESDAEAYLEQQGIPAIGYATSGEAFSGLRAGDIEAIVHDAAVLQHFVTNDSETSASLASLVFAERGFGLVLPPEQDLNEDLNRALLELVESDEFATLHNSWFGTDADTN